MDDTTKQICAKISALEFVLEIVLANELARTSEEMSAQFKHDLFSRPGQLPPRSGPVDADLFQELDQMTKVYLEDLARKVDKREREIRVALSRGL